MHELLYKYTVRGPSTLWESIICRQKICRTQIFNSQRHNINHWLSVHYFFHYQKENFPAYERVLFAPWYGLYHGMIQTISHPDIVCFAPQQSLHCTAVTATSYCQQPIVATWNNRNGHLPAIVTRVAVIYFAILFCQNFLLKKVYIYTELRPASLTAAMNKHCRQTIAFCTYGQKNPRTLSPGTVFNV